MVRGKGELRAGWKVAKGNKMGTSIIALKIKIKGKKDHILYYFIYVICPE